MAIPVFPEFTPLGLEHQQVVTSLLKAYPPQISELTFTNLFIWRHYYNFQLSGYEKGLLLLARPREQEPFFLPPIGFEDPLPAIRVCLYYLKENGWKSGICRVDRDTVEAYLSKDKELSVMPDRDHFDYVYLSQDLIRLAGRKYHRKKNHLNRFLRKYDFEYRPLTPELLEDCFKIVDMWCVLRNCEESPALRGEERAIREALMNMEVLSFRAGVLMVEGQVEAFALGEPLNPDTAVIHIEKANADIQGIYAAINQQFCQHEWAEFRYINREQDLGEPGLRKAKESYLPHHFVEKYRVTLKEPAGK